MTKPKTLPPVSSFPPNSTCVFCGTDSLKREDLGEVYVYDQCAVHYFCLLLATNVKQEGTDGEGILGFKVKDIKDEITKRSKVVCIYCKKKGATIYCAKPKCRSVFHLPCGRANWTSHQFFARFLSYCSKHRIVQKFPKEILNSAEPVICTLCLDPADLETEECLWSSCCRNLMHRSCTQCFALSAGYYMKCIICSDKKKFRADICKYGIFIPDRDASWETVENAYMELADSTRLCEANPCQCPKGRDYCSGSRKSKSEEKRRWFLEPCFSCGAFGIHIGCMTKKFAPFTFECECCDRVSKRVAKHRNKEIPHNNEPLPEIEFKKGKPAIIVSSDDEVDKQLPVTKTSENESTSSVEIHDANDNSISSQQFGELIIISDSEDEVELLNANVPVPTPKIEPRQQRFLKHRMLKKQVRSMYATSCNSSTPIYSQNDKERERGALLNFSLRRTENSSNFNKHTNSVDTSSKVSVGDKDIEEVVTIEDSSDSENDLFDKIDMISFSNLQTPVADHFMRLAALVKKSGFGPKDSKPKKKRRKKSLCFSRRKKKKTTDFKSKSPLVTSKPPDKSPSPISQEYNDNESSADDETQLDENTSLDSVTMRKIPMKETLKVHTSLFNIHKSKKTDRIINDKKNKKSLLRKNEGEITNECLRSGDEQPLKISENQISPVKSNISVGLVGLNKISNSIKEKHFDAAILNRTKNEQKTNSIGQKKSVDMKAGRNVGLPLSVAKESACLSKKLPKDFCESKNMYKKPMASDKSSKRVKTKEYNIGNDGVTYQKYMAGEENNKSDVENSFLKITCVTSLNYDYSKSLFETMEKYELRNNVSDTNNSVSNLVEDKDLSSKDCIFDISAKGISKGNSVSLDNSSLSENQIKLVSHLSAFSNMEIIEQSNCLEQSLGDEKATSHSHEALENVDSENNPLTKMTSHSHEALENIDSTDTPLTKTTSYSHEALKNIDSEDTPLTKTTSHSHESFDNIDSKDTPLAEATSHSHESLGNVDSKDTPLTKTTSLTEATSHSHELLENIDSKYTSLTEVSSHSHEALGNVDSKDTPLAKATSHSHESLEIIDSKDTLLTKKLRKRRERKIDEKYQCPIPHSPNVVSVTGKSALISYRKPRMSVKVSISRTPEIESLVQEINLSALEETRETMLNFKNKNVVPKPDEDILDGRIIHHLSEPLNNHNDSFEGNNTHILNNNSLKDEQLLCNFIEKKTKSTSVQLFNSKENESGHLIEKSLRITSKNNNTSALREVRSNSEFTMIRPPFKRRYSNLPNEVITKKNKLTSNSVENKPLRKGLNSSKQKPNRKPLIADFVPKVSLSPNLLLKNDSLSEFNKEDSPERCSSYSSCCQKDISVSGNECLPCPLLSSESCYVEVTDKLLIKSLMNNESCMKSTDEERSPLKKIEQSKENKLSLNDFETGNIHSDVNECTSSVEVGIPHGHLAKCKMLYINKYSENVRSEALECCITKDKASFNKIITWYQKCSNVCKTCDNSDLVLSQKHIENNKQKEHLNKYIQFDLPNNTSENFVVSSNKILVQELDKINHKNSSETDDKEPNQNKRERNSENSSVVKEHLEQCNNDIVHVSYNNILIKESGKISEKKFSESKRIFITSEKKRLQNDRESPSQNVTEIGEPEDLFENNCSVVSCNKVSVEEFDNYERNSLGRDGTILLCSEKGLQQNEKEQHSQNCNKNDLLIEEKQLEKSCLGVVANDNETLSGLTFELISSHLKRTSSCISEDSNDDNICTDSLKDSYIHSKRKKYILQVNDLVENNRNLGSNLVEDDISPCGQKVDLCNVSGLNSFPNSQSFGIDETNKHSSFCLELKNRKANKSVDDNSIPNSIDLYHPCIDSKVLKNRKSIEFEKELLKSVKGSNPASKNINSETLILDSYVLSPGIQLNEITSSGIGLDSSELTPFNKFNRDNFNGEKLISDSDIVSTTSIYPENISFNTSYHGCPTSSFVHENIRVNPSWYFPKPMVINVIHQNCSNSLYQKGLLPHPDILIPEHPGFVKRYFLKAFLFNKPNTAVIYTDSYVSKYSKIFSENIPGFIRQIHIYKKSGNLRYYLSSILNDIGHIDLQDPHVILIITSHPMVNCSKTVFGLLKSVTSIKNVTLVVTTIPGYSFVIRNFNQQLCFWSKKCQFQVWDINEVFFKQSYT